MDTRKLKGNTMRGDESITFAWETHKEGYYERTKLVFPADAEPLEILKRWNAHLDLVRHLDGILVQMEDSGTVEGHAIEEARAMLKEQGWGDKELGALADHNEGIEPISANPSADNDDQHIIKHLLSVIANLSGTVQEYVSMPCNSLRDRMRQCAVRSDAARMEVVQQMKIPT
jgi:hypothetical protein